MLQGPMIKALAAVVTAAVFAGVFTIVMSGLSQEVKASSPVVGVKGDRLDIGTLGAACSQRGWPYYETDCLRDRSRQAGRARPVRLVTLDRIGQ